MSSKDKVLSYIKQKIDIDGIAPSVREIAAAVGLKSPSSVHLYLKMLEEEGQIERMAGKNHRAIRLAGTPSRNIPLLGRVTAGTPILAVEQIEDYIPFKWNVSSDELFALRVVGESMQNIGILDGDIVICKKTNYCDNGDIVVALIDDSATVKRFFKEKGHFRLQPENDNFEPIICDEVMILGKVVSSLRYYDGI